MTAQPRLTAQAALATIGTATALSAVYADERWLVPVVVAVALVAAVNELTRRSPVAAALGPVLSAAAVLCYLTASNAEGTAYFGFIPTTDSLRVLGDLARSGFDDVRTLTTPVPTHRGLVMLAVVAIAGVELVVDLLAVTLRRAALAGLPLLAVFAVCTSVSKNGVGWIPFGFGAATYLWLLLADSRDRIRRWGRTFGAESGTGTRITWADVDIAPSPLSALGRRIGASAIAVGVIVPMLVPGLHGGLPKRGSGGDGTGRGSSQVVTLNPLVNIRAQLTSRDTIPLLRVRTTDLSPGYLRLTSLDHFDGTTFAPSTLVAPSSARVSHGINAPQVPGTDVNTTVDVSKLAVHWLPVPMLVRGVEAKGDWRYDGETSTVFSARADTHDLRFTVSSVDYEPTAAQLDGAPLVAPGQFARYLQLPPDLPDSVYSLAQSITAHSVSPFRKALAIQDYLTSPAFTYDTQVTSGASANALANFLTVSKRGFCQQFASSMAVLARMVGIPARVAVGFTRGAQQADGSWLVTSRDAHAWPELYFPGFGWQPFEPTPRTDGQTRQPSFTHTQATGGLNDVGPHNRVPRDSAAPLQSTIDKKLREPDVPVAKAAPAVRVAHAASPWWLVLALLLALLPVPALARAAGRRRRWSRATDSTQRAHAAWAELRAGAIDAGVEWIDGTTPRGAARLVAAETLLPRDAEAALARVVRAEERARYAASASVAGAESPDARDDVATVVRALLSRRSRWARVAAAVWPRSTMRTARAVAERVADVLDLLDGLGARVRRRWARLVQPPKPRPS